MTAVLSARDVGVRIGGRRLLEGIELELHPGELLVLVGPNGAGKSTLLSVLAGDRTPDEGVVELDGEPLSAHRVEDRARRRSVLTQSNEVSFPFRSLDVIRMGRAPWRRRPEAEHDDEAVREAVAAGEVGGYAERPVTSLSGGERARVAFARSFAQSCEIALLDEPTASLDIRHQHRVLAHTRARVAAGGAAIVVLHDLALAAAYADRIALLESGRLVAVGPPREVLQPELLTRVYRHPIHVLEGPSGALVVVADARPDPSGLFDPSGPPGLLDPSDSSEERTA